MVEQRAKEVPMFVIEVEEIVCKTLSLNQLNIGIVEKKTTDPVYEICFSSGDTVFLRISTDTKRRDLITIQKGLTRPKIVTIAELKSELEKHFDLKQIKHPGLGQVTLHIPASRASKKSPLR